MQKFAMYTEKIIKALPYWFKIKKDAKDSIGAQFLDIIGLELDNARYILDYAYMQNKVDCADEEFIDIVYKTILPDNLNIQDIQLVKSSENTLIKTTRLTQFFGINLNGIEYPELYGNHVFYADNSRNILYVRHSYDIEEDYPDGQITVTINNKPYTLALTLHHVWNFFDEFGMLLDCPRIYGENNKEYKKRILDVFENPGGSNKKGLLNGIARELGIRNHILWIDGEKDLILEDPMIVLNSINVDGILYSEKDVYITEHNTILIPGSTKYKNKERKVSYVSGIEMHQLHNKNDIKLDNELFNIDSSATNLLKYYTERIHSMAPIMWGQFRWNEAYWDISDSDLGGLAFIPNLYDGEVKGFTKFRELK